MARPVAMGPGAAGVRRAYNLNMPQMALGGLSEAWLFREVGDIHWEMISKGLQSPSSALADANGDRLYATFTRLRIVGSKPLLSFVENDPIVAEGDIRRFGAGVFFGDVTFSSPGGAITAQLMTSFTKRSSAQSNLSLLKGQPIIPNECTIPAISEMPEFAQQYRQIRSAGPRPLMFERRYEILPYHDINGVGLLYFAAYPTISDLNELHAFQGAEWSVKASTLSRDVHYYGNCDLKDAIVYRLHKADRRDGLIHLESSLSRASDDVLIAYIATTKSIIQTDLE